MNDLVFVESPDSFSFWWQSVVVGQCGGQSGVVGQCDGQFGVVGQSGDQSVVVGQCGGQSVVVGQCVGQCVVAGQCGGQSVVAGQCGGQSIVVRFWVGPTLIARLHFPFRFAPSYSVPQRFPSRAIPFLQSPPRASHALSPSAAPVPDDFLPGSDLFSPTPAPVVSDFPPGSDLFSPTPASVAADLLPRSRPAWRVFRPSPASVQVIPPRCSRRLLLRQPGLEPPPGPVASPDLGALVRAGGHGESGPGASAQTVAAGAMDRAPADQVGLGGSWGPPAASGVPGRPCTLAAPCTLADAASGSRGCFLQCPLAPPRPWTPRGVPFCTPSLLGMGPKGSPRLPGCPHSAPRKGLDLQGTPSPIPS